MAAKPKLSAAQWGEARARWEGDRRDGYAWLVEEMALPVSAPAVRKVSQREGWIKKDAPEPPTAVPERAGASSKSKASASKVSPKVSGRGSAKVSGGHEPERNHAPETLASGGVKTIESDPDKFGALAELTDKQEIFVREYMTDWDATKAAIRAGYSAKSARHIGWELLDNPNVRESIKALASARAKRLGIDADELMKLWASVLALDFNELSQLRRVCCPYCWGEDHQRQYTPSSLEKAKEKHDRERARRLKADATDDVGEFPEYADAWYDKRKPPHQDCPECGGEGSVEVYFADTRNLSPAARLVYAGVKDGREGIEILTMSKEKAADNLARALGLFKEKEADVTINLVSSEDLNRLYEEKMQIARARQAAVLAERGLVIDAEDTALP